MVQGATADFEAFDAMRARNKWNDVLEAWISFGNTYIPSPPAFSRDDPDWRKKFNEIADLLGIVRKALDEGSFQTAHDQLEPIVGKISLLAMPIDQAHARKFLELEIKFSMLKPGFQGKEKSVQLAEIASLSEDLALMTPEIPENIRSKLVNFRGLLLDFSRAVERSTVSKAPHQLGLYKKLNEVLIAVKKSLMDIHWLEQEVIKD